jgi:hypothetical protein
MHRLGTACVAALLWAQGCAGPGIPKGPPVETPMTGTPAADPVNQGLTAQTLQNATYRWGEGGRDLIQFRDGKFRGPVVPGSIDEVRISMLDRIGRGDLDGDGVEDAAVILVHDPGGTATYYVLVAVINQSGSPDQRGDIVLGDRIQVGAVTIEGGKIFVEVVRPSSADPSAAPARRIKESYKLVAGRLERADFFR